MNPVDLPGEEVCYSIACTRNIQLQVINNFEYHFESMMRENRVREKRVREKRVREKRVEKRKLRYHNNQKKKKEQTLWQSLQFPVIPHR